MLGNWWLRPWESALSWVDLHTSPHPEQGTRQRGGWRFPRFIVKKTPIILGSAGRHQISQSVKSQYRQTLLRRRHRSLKLASNHPDLSAGISRSGCCLDLNSLTATARRLALIENNAPPLSLDQTGVSVELVEFMCKPPGTLGRSAVHPSQCPKARVPGSQQIRQDVQNAGIPSQDRARHLDPSQTRIWTKGLDLHIRA